MIAFTLALTVALAGLTDPTPLQAKPAGICAIAAEGLKDMRHRAKPGPEVRLKLCAIVAQKAYDTGEGDALAARVIAMAYNEANFRPEVTGSRGERGMLQVIPEKHCQRVHPTWKPGQACDYEAAGVAFLVALLERERCRKGRFDWARVLSKYNGSRNGGVTRYGRKVEGYARSIMRRLRKARRGG